MGVATGVSTAVGQKAEQGITRLLNRNGADSEMSLTQELCTWHHEHFLNVVAEAFPVEDRDTDGARV